MHSIFHHAVALVDLYCATLFHPCTKNQKANIISKLTIIKADPAPNNECWAIIKKIVNG